MSSTGNHDFDRLKDEFSATVRDIEATMHKRAAVASSIVGNINHNASASIRKASSILSKLSSVAKDVSETEQPALKQELLDIYKACKMQLKTYKSLHKQVELFQDTNTTYSTSITMATSERTVLFANSTTTRDSSIDDSSKDNNTSGSASSTENSRDQIISTTQGRLGKQNSRIRDALRSLKESEQVAQEISGELIGQRETLQTTQGRLDQFSSMNEHSNNLLDSMNKPWWRKW
jgi:hypothetical protein